MGKRNEMILTPEDFLSRDRFCVYRNAFVDTIRRIKKVQARCELYDAMMEYGFFGVVPEKFKNFEAELAFPMIKNLMEIALKKSKEQTEKKKKQNESENNSSNEENSGNE